MFEQLFRYPSSVARQRQGPLAEERCRYLVHCAAQHMTRRSLRVIASYTLAIAQTLCLAERPGELLTRAEIEAGADRYVRLAHRRHPRRPQKHQGLYLRRSFTGYALRWLTFLGRLQTPHSTPGPYADHVAQFAEYLHRERGLSPQTIMYSRRTLQAFLAQLDAAALCLQTLTAAQVNDLLIQKVLARGYARTTIRRWASVLRPFFRYAERYQWCRRGLAEGIATARAYRHEGLPVGPSWSDVQRLLAAAAGDHATDIRTRALLLLLAVYGLRAGEVTALRLDDFDWQQNLLTVPSGKRQQPRIYPLCRSVGEAVLRYIRDVRPRTAYREVFLLLRAPFHPMGSSALRDVVRKRLRALGLTLPHYGPHVLRHACATHLVAQGLSLKEIGDHLGHQSLQSTRIYAKVDVAGLRTVGDFSLEGLL